VFSPVPDPTFCDLLITNLLHFVKIFFCDLTSVLLAVAVRTALPFSAKPIKLTDFLSEEKTRFSSLRI